MPLTNKAQRELAKKHGVAVAKSHYEMFLQDKFRGPQFKWDCLPDLAVSMAEVSMYTSFPHKSKIWDELVNICMEAAHEEANRLLENMDD
jgi:hypothetical protein